MDVAAVQDQMQDGQAEIRELARGQMEAWFKWMDHLLDIHRGNFLFREATPARLEQHKTALKLAVRTCHLMHALVADPDFHEPDLARRLRTRARQLEDAYNTFDDPELSDERASQILKEVFPE
jgi:hypothetical protein